MNGETCGSVTLTSSIDATALTLMQVRYDPDSYTSSTVMDIYGMMSDDCIMKFSYSSDTIQVTQTYDLEVRGAYRLYTITPEHFDVT